MHPRLRNADVARHRFGALAQRLSGALDRGDPLADALIERMEADPREHGRLIGALSHGIDAVDRPSPELRALFAALEHVPDWVDWERVARGGRTFYRAGPIGGISLGARSLVGGYASPMGNKPLVLSGRLYHDVPRRLAETGAFVAATHAPDGLRRFGEGFAAVVHVRLMHARARAHAQRHPEWRAEWGVPINQHDLAGTMLLFSTVWADGVRTMGVNLTAEEIEDHLHLWRYATYVIGVEDELIPRTRAEAAELAAFIELTEDPPDEDSRRLVAALIDATPVGTGRRFKKALGAGLLRGVLGREKAEALGVPRTPLTAVVPAMRQVARPVTALARRSRLVDDLLVRQGEVYWAAASVPWRA